MRLSEMRHIHVILLLLAIATACRSRAPHDVPAEGAGVSHTVADVISNNKVTSFAEDAQGHIWIATDRGLNRYTVNEYHQYFSDSTAHSLCHDHIRQVYRDRRDNLWVATLDGVNLYTDRDVFRKIPVDELSQNATQFFEDNDGRLFLNMNVHLCEYDPDSCKFVSRIHRFDPYGQFSSTCYVDRSNRIWVVNPSLLRCYSTPAMERLDSIPLDGYYTASMLDDTGRLWLATRGRVRVFDVNARRFEPAPETLAANPRLRETDISILHPYGNGFMGVSDRHLFVYDRTTDSLVFDDEIGFPFKAPGFRISTVYTDRVGNIWFGSEDQGYSVVYRYHDRFANYLSAFFRNRSVVSMGAVGNTLVALTLDKEIYVCDHTGKNPPARSQVLPAGTGAYTVRADNEGHIWLLTQNKAYRTRVAGTTLVPDGAYDVFFPTSLAQDRNGTVWMGSYTENLYALRKGADAVTPIQIRPRTFTFTSDLHTLSDGRVMAVTFDYPMLFVNPDNWSLVQSRVGYANSGVQALTSKFTPTSLFQDSRGAVWVGTIGNGLLRYDCAADSLARVEGITCTDICDVQEDSYGNVWISTKYGLNKYDYTTDRVSRFYMSDGIGGNQFYPNSSARMPDGTLIFGGTHGLTVFNPSDIVPERKVSVCFENLRVHNRLVIPEHSDVIDRVMSLNPEVRLSHDQNSFSISFVALEYGDYERTHYMYMLEGVDPYWIDAGNSREVFYSNLPAGKYRFRVKATSPDKDEVEAENSIEITVKPSPFASWWAKTIYLLLLLALLYVVWRIYSRIKEEKERVRFAEQEKLQEKKVNEMNMSFFANISHEFRTPLTLIAGPVAELSETGSLTEAERGLMAVVKRNVARMQRLVNQILDFHKLENDTLRLQVEEADMIATVKGVVETFAYNARQKGISLVGYGLEDSFISPVDSDKIEKIIYNLLSNAIKFTPAGGQIEISFDIISAAAATAIMPELKAGGPLSADYMKITVTDDGPGIPADKLSKVFERYYQCEGEGRYNWGTGIGLYYARKLAVIHHGYLVAQAREGGHGTVMTLCIPVGETAFSENEKVRPVTEKGPQTLIAAGGADDGPAGGADDARKRILVVDDDVEIAHYLKSLLDRSYNVLCRHDAASAFAVLPEFNPDLVITDVVMPGGSGTELCNSIKESPQFCHIPVILLTARHTVTDQVEGLDSGADAYVTKPFDPAYLLAMVRTTIDNRNRIREMLNAHTASAPAADNGLAPHDRIFMDELYALMESELSNTELDIVKVLDVLKISRTKLYYKLKGLTGQTPANFFKIYKLNRAAELLKTGKYNISEIADMTGFSTLSHFSTSFKKQFGVSPSDYV